MASKWVKFRDTAEAIIGLGAQILLPFIPVLSTLTVLPRAVVALLNAVPALMAVFEQAMPESGSGPARKTAVLNSTKALMAYLETQFTGGAKGNFEKLRPAIEAIIEGTIGMVNGLAPQIIGDDPVVVSSPPIITQ